MPHRILKGVTWAVAGLLAFVLIVLALLYVPIVQDKILGIAVEKVYESTGMKISVERFRLNFPVEVNLDGVAVHDAGGDTLAAISSARIDVGIIPLLQGEVSIAEACIDNVYYKMGTRDSAVYLKAEIGVLALSDAKVKPAENSIIVQSAGVDNGKVELFLANDTADAPAKEEREVAWNIIAGRLKLTDVDYCMAVNTVIDTLSTRVVDAELLNGRVDMPEMKIKADALSVELGKTVYLYSDKEPSGNNSVGSVDSATVSAGQWQIDVDKLVMGCESALYAQSGRSPEKGLDMGYIEVSAVSLAVDSFYNRGVEIAVPLRELRMTERSGVGIGVSGMFSMDSTMMDIRGFEIETLFSSLRVNASMGVREDYGKNPVALQLNGRIGMPDVELLYPSLLPLLKEVPRYNDIIVKADVDGTMDDVDIHEMSVSLPGSIDLFLDGNVRNVMKKENLSGRISVGGTITDVDYVKPTILEARLAEQVEIPPLTLAGNVEMYKGDVSGSVEVTDGNGRIALDAAWKGRAGDYDVKLDVDSFPVNAVFPEAGVNEITARFDAEGHGYDVSQLSTRVKAEMSLDRVEYKGNTYGNMRVWATLDSCVAEVGMISLNKNADMDLIANGVIDKSGFKWDMSGDIRKLDLKAMGLSTSSAGGTLSVTGKGKVSTAFDSIAADVAVSGLEWTMADIEVSATEIRSVIETTGSMTKITVDNNDLNAELQAKCSIDSLLSSLGNVSGEFMGQLSTRRIDVSRIQSVLPQFYLDVAAGNDNVVESALSSMGMSLGEADISISNDSLLMMSVSAGKFVSGETRIDRIGFNAFQESRFMVYRASIDNNPGTMDAFAHMSLNGYVADNRIGAYFRQRNINDETGYNLGLILTMTDSIMSVNFTPFNPTIAYKSWTVNEDNYVGYNVYTKHFDANLEMEGDGSHLKLYTEHSDSLHRQEDVVMNISHIKLSDWLAVSPFAPPVKGDISADMRFRWDEHSLSGNGSVALDELKFGKNRVGSFLLDVNMLTDKKGKLQAETSLMIDSVKAMTAIGCLNDTASDNPVNLDFSMIHFPLHILNPFLPPGTARLSGLVNGEMDITGSISSPVFNGYIDFDSASVKVDMIGSSFAFSEERVPVENNIITFDNYTIKGVNDNPLYVNGNISLAELSPEFNLSMKARNMQILGNSRGKRIDVYGKGFVDVDATVRGNLDLLNIGTTLNLLPGSNITYVMADAVSAVSAQNAGEMVEFVRFDDNIAESDTAQNSGLSMNIDAMLIVSNGTTINVDLSTDGKNKVQLQGSGSLNYTMNNMADSRVTGRYTIAKGFARYTPPLMSEKLFDFVEGSYVAFNGDMLNPILNISAVDDIRANVTREGQDSRLVNFEVLLSVTNTLNNMNVAFDLSTPDDITIQNELQSMSAGQRANQAMNMLLYNVYTGPGTKADGNLSGNPLFSILESRINTWAANNIRFVDISFGIDRYDNTTGGTTSTATSYSYKVSKTLFNDRFKIIVGGNYTTDADADESFSQNLINDISFEYMLNRSGSMFVRIFRHVGYESILEGEVTQTGVGFVYKRKIHSLRDLFRSMPKSSHVPTGDVNLDTDEKK